MERATYAQMRFLEDRHWWFCARRQILADQIGRLGLPPHAAILEVGCGSGGNLQMLSRFGALTALEPDTESRAFAAERADAVVLEGVLPDALPVAAASFDLVAALDVIEHVEADAASVRSLAALLNVGGYFVATVPAYQWLWSGHDEVNHHKRRYTLGAFRTLFEGGDLAVRKATYFNTVLFPAIASVRVLKNALRLGGDDDERLPGPVLNVLLRGLFAAERFWLRGASFPAGVSILVIAQRVR